MVLAEADRFFRTGSDIARFQNKDIKGGNYGEILYKDGNKQRKRMQANNTLKEEYYDNENFKYTMDQDENPSDYSNLTLFEEDNYSEQQKNGCTILYLSAAEKPVTRT